MVIDTIWDFIKSSQREVADLEGAKSRAIRYHQAIFDGIKNRDEMKAKKAMLAHLNNIEKTVRKYHREKNEKESF